WYPTGPASYPRGFGGLRRRTHGVLARSPSSSRKHDPKTAGNDRAGHHRRGGPRLERLHLHRLCDATGYGVHEPRGGRAVARRHVLFRLTGHRPLGDAQAPSVEVRRVVEEVSLAEFASFPMFEIADEVREEPHRHVRIHEGDAELLREHEQVDGIVVPDPHLHVLGVEVVDEEAPEDLLHRLRETTHSVQPLSPLDDGRPAVRFFRPDPRPLVAPCGSPAVAETDLGLVAVLAVAAFFSAWYFAAFVYSRRLAARLAREMKEAVLGLGGTWKVRWFGTTAFRMTTEEADDPFRGVSVTMTLRPREMPINWAIGTAQGRKDAALVEAALRKSPKVGFELVDPATRIGQRRRRARSDWSSATVGERAVLLAADDADRVLRLLETLEPTALTSVMALNVTAGGTPGIAASLSVDRGDAKRGLSAIRALADRLVA